MTEHYTFIHLTDLHIGNPDIVDDHLFSDTTANLKALLADVKSLVPQPKFIVATGDLTNQGDAGSYRTLKTILDEAGLDIPVLFALGNHDKREGFYTGMLGQTGGGPLGATTNIFYVLWEFGFSSMSVGWSSAAAVILFLAFGALAFVLFRLIERYSFYDN